MKKLKVLSCAGVLATLLLAGCAKEEPVKPQPKDPDPEIVNVFVLSGQSNMEGNTSFKNGNDDYLATAFTELGLNDVSVCYDGIESVKTSLYCAGYGQLNHNNLNGNTQVNSTNKTNRFEGEFLPTQVGMGLNSTKMGPELGCAYGLKDHATSEKPIYFIKMASGGSGFEQDTNYNWPVKDANGNFPEVNMYHTFCKPFIDNNMKIIEKDCEEKGYKPVIKAWLWHQGESDTSDEKEAKYAQRLGDMVELFRNDYAKYAVDEDGANIAFIDGMICESSTWNKPDVMNAKKQEFANSNPMNFLIDTHANEDKTVAANELKTGNPGGDSMHYNTKSSFRLGMAYAKVILDNNLLDE